MFSAYPPESCILYDQLFWQCAARDPVIRWDTLKEDIFVWCTSNRPRRLVPAGRLFLRRLIDLSTKARRLHHRIRLNGEARAEIQWWHTFLPAWNGTAMFLDPRWTLADSMHLYTDASGAHGFGAYYDGAWFRGNWFPHQRSPRVSIQWQELFPILLAASIWGHRWMGKRITFHCDNLAIVLAWQGKSCRNPCIMTLLRRLFLVTARGNFTVAP